ncbi:uncharacterized protein LOC115069479 [Nannospalax galili]|uniref:uncharacterized protein LOC115069479 n=1 Tax=Nannospalax galili TaxID=1026970 RepID=UPI00111C90EB|nr:uncharacterized protein LOC115069479 [Nannospalax galili]
MTGIIVGSSKPSKPFLPTSHSPQEGYLQEGEDRLSNTEELWGNVADYSTRSEDNHEQCRYFQLDLASSRTLKKSFSSTAIKCFRKHGIVRSLQIVLLSLWTKTRGLVNLKGLRPPPLLQPRPSKRPAPLACPPAVPSKRPLLGKKPSLLAPLPVRATPTGSSTYIVVELRNALWSLKNEVAVAQMAASPPLRTEAPAWMHHWCLGCWRSCDFL